MAADSKEQFIPIDNSIKLSFIYLFMAWTIIIVGIITWSYYQLREETHILAYKEANKSYEKDLMFRYWTTMHGGVYVPITDSTQPNPYLNIVDRDIVTPSGKKYTLMNPAYMTRQINELSRQKFNILSNITSLNPIRPLNKADAWESKALASFERGDKEFYGLDTIRGTEYYRFMAPLVTTAGCLKCHAVQGYKLGDNRGGLSTAVTWSKYSEAFRSQLHSILIGYGILWILGLLGINVVRTRFVMYIVERKKAENIQNKLIEELRLSKEEIEENLFRRNQLVVELTDTKEQLESANAAKDKFFSIIAHDLKNPLGSFRSMLDLLVEHYNTFEEQERKDFLTMMKDSSTQLYNLLENLLEWSRSQRGLIKFNPNDTDLRMLAQNSITVLRLQADKKQIKLVNNIPSGSVAFADENLISTVIRNLMSNAIKFTREGGEITVGVINSSTDSTTCYIKDSGIGMNESIKAKLFRIDDTITNRGTADEAGTGLGLILCKEFIEMHGGKIWAESEVGSGSTFYFTLPVAKSSRTNSGI